VLNGSWLASLSDERVTTEVTTLVEGAVAGGPVTLRARLGSNRLKGSSGLELDKLHLEVAQRCAPYCAPKCAPYLLLCGVTVRYKLSDRFSGRSD
jgi:hypothetical protein